mmetsp:Transcript_32400/g.48848  ORF Transcript_32400/g.48848 Transcript_32400/m.48848 type:complete len:502 (+) Transcript_32400:71-1576(+)|eukprot:CAMPEP_0178935648 /NCGR_PEP_ID=MMETSP0786-20121207/24672_1 /TAXON_ID=186022 /ORGANISM="Thalassionema frauenfeldii, Strain CCMP 1798" /LENGTH=501 /DNA_ID=CAMNT_0020613839 /DNA_START=123 /DNA_END=1628 /DNA_ORIENTATION=+
MSFYRQVVKSLPARFAGPIHQSRLSSHAVSTKKTSHPSSIHAISTGVSSDASGAGVHISKIGCLRRVFILNSHLSLDEMKGMAYRIRLLSKNPSLNSILISPSIGDGNIGTLPSSVFDVDELEEYLDKDNIPHLGGYNPLSLYKSGAYKEEDVVKQLLDCLSDLSLAIRGDAEGTRIPVLTLPLGLVHDSGYALCTGGYVLATENTSFRIMNPSRGLSFDPIGLSFILPRLGWEFQQQSADYVGCGLILALSAMEANAEDMMQTGLATHYIGSASKLGQFESCLADLSPWNQQELLRRVPRFYGQPERTEDFNKDYRNASVANLIKTFSTYEIREGILFDPNVILPNEDDPSLNLDHEPVYLKRKSKLLNHAVMFDAIFKQENTVFGIVERLKEVANRDSIDEEMKETISMAKSLVQRIEQQSALAVSVVYRLMQVGGKRGQSMDSCIEREKNAQVKLFKEQDFQNWAKHTASSKCDERFSDWEYKRLDDVPEDQVKEIVG